MEAHRSGPLKQANKKHKSLHSTKRAIDRTVKGRVENARQPAKVADRAAVAAAGKASRLNANKQARAAQKEALAVERRLGPGGLQGPPRSVCFLALSDIANPVLARDSLLAQASTVYESSSSSLVGGALLATFTAPKHKVLLIPSGPRELLTSLYACKACDIVVLVVSAAGGQEGLYDAVGSTFLTALKAQGMPAVVGYVQGLGDLPSKKSSEMLRYCTRFFQSEFGEDGVKLAVEGSPHQLIRCVANAKLRPMQWRSQRPCVVAHAVTFTPVAGTEVGTLTVTGYLRGQGLKQGCLLHIAEVGSFAAGPVSAAVDPEGVRVKEGCVFPAPPPAPPASVCPFEPLLPPPSLLADENPLEGEQTWPTRAELAGVSRKRAAGGGGGEESSEEDDSLDDDSDDGGDDEDEAGDSMEDSEGSEDGGALGAGADGGGDFSDMEDEPEPETKPGKVKEEEEAEKNFPDEVDTPEDTPAKVRFGRYRGLKSFRTSEWDAKESLPASYSRIFQFENFAKTQKQVLAEQAAPILFSESDLSRPDEWVNPGSCVVVTIPNVPASAVASRPSWLPLIVTGLLKYENLTSLLHFSITRHAEYEEPIKSKELLEFHVGYRRFDARPVFSQDNINCDKHKFERFLPSGVWSVASVFGPIVYSPCPVLVFKRIPDPADGSKTIPVLVATGSVTSVDPDRVIVKRIILSGVPVKVKSRYAVVKHMFFNPDDVKWFKPVELWTKFGRTGNITESLGLHGLYKCIFNRGIKQNDTVCMSLYKRVYPKWGSCYQSLVEDAADREHPA